jgi:DNA-binding NtrC family response regulator
LGAAVFWLGTSIALRGVVQAVSTHHTSLRGSRILLIEHDRDLAWFFLEVLREHGAEVTLIGAPADAIHVLRREEIDVVIFDFDGVADAALWHSLLARWPLVMIRGLASRRPARRHGVELQKPVEVRALVEAVEAASAA